MFSKGTNVNKKMLEKEQSGIVLNFEHATPEENSQIIKNTLILLKKNEYLNSLDDP